MVSAPPSGWARPSMRMRRRVLGARRSRPRAPRAHVGPRSAGGTGPRPGGLDHDARHRRGAVILPVAGWGAGAAARARRSRRLDAGTRGDDRRRHGREASSSAARGSGPNTRPIAAAAVVVGVQATAPTLDSFAATFAVTEHGLSPDVPERRLRMDVAFLAPLRFRLDVHDETTYPSARWTPTDLTFIADGSSTYRSGATGCPADLPAGGCPPTRTTITTRSAYSVQAPAPADLVLPLTTFSSADGIQVLGTDRVAGRDAIRVRLTFARRTGAVPVPRARWDVASVLRRRPRGPVAGCVGLVPVALHGLSVDRSVASAVGAPVRPPARTDGPSRSSTCGSLRWSANAPDAATFEVPGWTRARRTCRSRRSPDASATCRSRRRARGC